MRYNEFVIELHTKTPEIAEIVSAYLTYDGFDSFQFTDDNNILAYISTDIPVTETLEKLKNELYSNWIKNIEVKQLEDKNWNQIWESSYEPVIVSDNCIVRAPFHTNLPEVKFDIKIMPKMSFGTAHHATTLLMMKYILETNVFTNLSVLDMGCGTGILAILAALKNAKTIWAVDNDTWAFENVKENIKANNCEHIQTFLGDADILSDEKFDYIFANINKNILLNDLPTYANSLNKNGHVFLSGFYLQDLDGLIEKAKTVNLSFIDYKEKDNWVAAHFCIN
ncbi:MAG: 50S ribosomal protein L11 methyltransferase [Bacteroidales bacterium]|jgi:ribosomal protein L11 methyltransferase